MLPSKEPRAATLCLVLPLLRHRAMREEGDGSGDGDGDDDDDDDDNVVGKAVTVARHRSADGRRIRMRRQLCRR